MSLSDRLVKGSISVPSDSVEGIGCLNKHVISLGERGET